MNIGNTKSKVGQLVYVILSLACLALISSCAQAPSSSDKASKPTPPPVWPAPPDLPRFMYETTLRTADNIARNNDEDRLKRYMTSNKLPAQPAFGKISAVAARKGRIYIADISQRCIVVFDVVRGKVYRFGQRAPDNIKLPVGIALDDKLNVYVADANRRQILVFDHLGLFLRAIGSPSELERPTGVAVDSTGNRIYVIDRSNNESENHRVVIFDSEGTRISEFGKRGHEPGQFNMPVQGAVARNGTLYVLDAGNFRVQAFDADGKFIRSFGAAGSGLGNLARPKGLAVDDENNVYVSDSFFGNFQIFNDQGQLLLAVGRSNQTDAPGQFGLISGLAVDETGRVYVGDQLFNKVEVIRRLNSEEAQNILRLRTEENE